MTEQTPTPVNVRLEPDVAALAAARAARRQMDLATWVDRALRHYLHVP